MGVDLTFNWHPSDVIGVLSSPVLSHYNGSEWEIAMTGSNSINGDSLIHKNYVSNFSPFGIGKGPSPLPVSLINFNAKSDNKHQQVMLTWQTTQEVNNDYFEILHSTDGATWNTIGSVQGNGSSYQLNDYAFTDFNPKSTNFYRLKQVDYNEDEALSEIRLVKFSTKHQYNYVNVYPNPAQNSLSIISEQQNVPYILTDIYGKSVLSGVLTNTKTELNIAVLTNGIYFIKIGENTLKIVKQ